MKLCRWTDNSNPCANSNPNRFPLDFLHIYCNFTICKLEPFPDCFRGGGGSCTQATHRLEKKFCFPFDHFYTILPLITRTMFYSVWQVEKKKLYRSPKHSDSLYINQTLLFNFFIQNTIFISVTTLFMHLLNVFLFPAICFKVPITRTFFDFPRRFELSGVDRTLHIWNMKPTCVIDAYSYFEKSCRKKCTPQSRKALWVVLSSLFFKEIWKNWYERPWKCVCEC